MPKDIKKMNITYSGDGIINGEMDLESFAASILNFGKAIKVIKDHLGMEGLDIKIAATREGSFEVDLILAAQGGWGVFKGIFGSEDSNAISNFLGIFGFGASGIIALFKHLKGKEPKEIKQDKDAVSITNEDGITLDFSLIVVQIYQDPKFGEFLEKFTDPLDLDEIDNIKIRQDKNYLELDKKERAFYKKPFLAKDPTAKKRIYTQTFGIVSLNFEEGKKWKLSDGRGNISVAMKDEAFLRKIANNEIDFAKGDRLVCEIELIEDLSEEKIKSNYSVLVVKEHIKIPRAIKLPGFEES